MTGQIIGVPKSDWIYEFTVVSPLPDGNFMWIKDFEDADAAYSFAEANGYTVAHNVRVCHKERNKQQLLEY